MQNLSIYDMDRTITIRGTYTPFLFHMVFARAPWRLLAIPLLPFGFIAYGLNLISRNGLKTYNQRLLLGSKPSLEKLEPHIAAYAEKTVRRNSYAKALAQIDKDRKEGRRIILATASYELYVNAIARLLNIDDVIATKLEIDNRNRVLPKIVGENCYDKAKLDRIISFLQNQGLVREKLHIRVYSDHISDSPMMEYADEAIATTPSAAMRSFAKKSGWEIVDWN